jgi:energy-coupling factor transporter ATP-binding protein EcfA2
MHRKFNTTGPCIAGVHYMIPPERRLVEVRPLVEEGLFFVIHAPRQSGKTTLLNTLARALNHEGKYTALAASVERLRRIADQALANREIIHLLHEESRSVHPAAEQAPDTAPFASTQSSGLFDFLRAWAIACPKPIVLLLDEIDTLLEDPLLSVLGQLRTGYTARPLPFVHSLALVGLRDVRDYKVKLRPDSESLGTSSPFNVKAKSLTLHNFTKDEVAELYQQHTEDTGQVFTPEASLLAFEQTRGQPWLVNALAAEITEERVPDRAQAITAAHVVAATEVLIQRRDTHLDSLVNKLHEPRVRQIIEPLLAGTTIPMDAYNDDLLYAKDLGLVEAGPAVRIANPIYQEIIPRTLTYLMQANISEQASSYTRPDGSLDMRALLRAFQAFFAEHSEAWLGRFDYQEAGPHLILMAFLQSVINGGGAIRREFAIGSGRVDLLLEWKTQREAIELKVRRGDKTEAQGVEQLSRYLDRIGLEEGFLVLFDQRKTVSWDDKLFEREVAGDKGKKICVIGA